MGCVSDHAANVVAFVDAPDLLLVDVDDGDVDAFRREMSGDRRSDLTRAAHDDSHSLSPSLSLRNAVP